MSASFFFSMLKPYGLIIVIIAALLIVMLVIIPLAMKLKRKRIKSKETREIMKDLFTWRHLARLVKGGEDHDKAKLELSDNIVRINELFKQGAAHVSHNIQNPFKIPWYVMLGEPRAGKSSLLAASELELTPSAEEENPQEDPRQSLPLRFWVGAKAAVYDISGKVFFDRWLEESGAEWNYIVRQICRRKGPRILDGVIITVPADALLADDENLSSKKAILIANELGKLLRQSGMRLPCYVVVTKLDMVSGFQEYVRNFNGDLRHQILGFESDAKFFHKETFERFWGSLVNRFRSGAKQLLFPLASDKENGGVFRMDMAGKIWLFPDNFNALYKNLYIYLDAIFGENNFHGTKDTFFEGVYFTSSLDQGFAFSPDIAFLAGKHTEDMLIPVFSPNKAPAEAAVRESGPPELPVSSTALMAVNAGRTMLAPYLRKKNRLHGYFIREFLHQRVFVPSVHAEYVRAEAIRRHIPLYILCAAMIFLGLIWFSGALFGTDELQVSMIQAESYYSWLGGVMRKGGPFNSPLITEEAGRGFILNNEPVEGESFSSRVQFYYNALLYRDLKIAVPAAFRVSEAVVFRFDRNMGYRDKAFIANQLHKAMVRIPVIKNTGARLIEQVDTQTLDRETRNIITSFISLDAIEGVNFYKYFKGPHFKLDSMIRYLIPDISDDAMEFLTSYQPRYDQAWAPQMDADYIYSGDYRDAKRNGIETILSAWRRRMVYPDSIYWKIRTLASISEEIIANYEKITAVLNRINLVSNPEGVERAVLEWKELTDRHKNMTARGRAVFEDVRALMRAAHIPLAFEHRLPEISISGKGVAKRPAPDAFGDNLINDYLFNDLVLKYALSEYTELFDADMALVRQEIGISGLEEVMGEIISVQNNFKGDLNLELEELRRRARILQNNRLLSEKTGDKPEDLSLFMVIERILTLSSGIPLPRREQNRNFAFNMEQGQISIKNARDAFEAYVKPYAENKELAAIIANARVMMLAEAYYNRYIIFTGSLAFLNTFEGNIASIVESEAKGGELFPFSGDAIEELFGGFYFHRRYDPYVVKVIADDVASFISIFKEAGTENLPLFLRNVDKNIYQPPAFMEYLANYFNYWGNYPENVYVSAGTWERFKARSRRYKSFQINSVLLSIYAGSMEATARIDDSLLTNTLVNLKSKTTAAMGNRLALLNQVLSADAERMFSAWAALPEDPLIAYNMLRRLSGEDLNSSYLVIYTSPVQELEAEGQPQALSLGWWNSFVLDGLNILARETDTVNMARLLENMERYRAWPLASDAAQPLSTETMEELAVLLRDMGVDAQEETDPAAAALRHNLFQGSSARKWAQTMYRISAAAADTQKPLVWTLAQAPTEIQQRLGGRGRLLAINRFRYVETSAAGGAPKMSSTYMNEKQPLFNNNAADGNLKLQFYLTSRERSPGAFLAINRPWAVFEFYLRDDNVADDKGNSYIPLYFTDEADRYVYYTALEFNRELPAPSSWYSLKNWPNLMISGRNIIERRGSGAEP